MPRRHVTIPTFPPLREPRLSFCRNYATHNTVPDIVPVLDETFKIPPNGTGVLAVQVHQVEVVGVVNRLEDGMHRFGNNGAVAACSAGGLLPLGYVQSSHFSLRHSRKLRGTRAPELADRFCCGFWQTLQS